MQWAEQPGCEGEGIDPVEVDRWQTEEGRGDDVAGRSKVRRARCRRGIAKGMACDKE